jgi:hypothetical protein
VAVDVKGTEPLRTCATSRLWELELPSDFTASWQSWEMDTRPEGSQADAARRRRPTSIAASAIAESAKAPREP